VASPSHQSGIVLNYRFWVIETGENALKSSVMMSLIADLVDVIAATLAGFSEAPFRRKSQRMIAYIPALPKPPVIAKPR